MRQQTSATTCHIAARELRGAIFLWAMIVASPAFAWIGPRSSSPGDTAVTLSGKNAARVGADAELFDGKIDNRQAGTVTVDRRIQVQTVAGAEYAFSAWTLVCDVAGRAERRRQADPDVEQRLVDATASELEVTASGVVDLPAFSLIAGLSGWLVPSYTEEVQTESTASKTRFSSVTATSLRGGIFRRSERWSGGVFGVQSVSVNRRFAKEATVGSASAFSGDTVFFVAGYLAATALVRGGPGSLRGELAAVQGGSGGPKTSSGESLFEDFLRFKFVLSPNLGSDQTAADMTITHQTLSYASNTATDLETIPVSSARLVYRLGPSTQYVAVGAGYTWASDRQSLREFNADYTLSGYSLALNGLIQF